VVDSRGDQLRGGLPGASEMQLVLDDLEEGRRVLARRVVVGGQHEDLPHSQVHPLLARADVPDALQ